MLNRPILGNPDPKIHYLESGIYGVESRIQGCRGSLTLDELKTCVPHGTKWIDEGSLRCRRKKGQGEGKGGGRKE